MMCNAEKWFYWLDEVTKDHCSLVGKKCAHLGEMTRAGFHVPQGFALSLDAYRLFLDKTGAMDEMSRYLASFEADPNANTDLPKWAEASDALRAIVESKSMPGDMAEPICVYYREVCRRTGLEDCAVATRSAGPASHPGQYETFLHVRGEKEVLRNIIRVWGSTFNQRSLVARARAGLSLEFDPIGVAVLQMVNARVAGVMFTLNPANGDVSKVSIGGSWGFGESVVSGSVTPDEWMVDKVVMEISKRSIAPKCMMYVVDSSSGREEVVAADVPPEKQNVPCLSDEEVLELARIGKTIEQHYGTPQDIEWVIDKELPFPENIFVVQTRPETAWRDKEKQSVLGGGGPLAAQVCSYLVNIKG
jgi:pyruvate, water dikinase